MTQIIINSNSRESCRRCLEDALVMSKKLRAVSETSDNTGTSSEAARGSVALIIDGTSLVYILDNELEEQVITYKFTFSIPYQSCCSLM
jgi:phospholipid-transporting ATPase